MIKKLVKKIFLLSIFTMMICSINLFVNSNDKVASNVVYAEEVATTPTVEGTCGTSATWKYYEDATTLEIEGNGELITYTYGTAPWYDYASVITKVIVADTITSISNGVFYGFDSLQEIILPFVGQGRTATYEQSVFGYIFGYTATNVYDNPYTGIFQGVTKSRLYDVDRNKSTKEKSFVDYYINIENSTGKTWQYSCYDYYEYYSNYNLNCYYYYIPSSITKVTITGVSKINACAFLNCNNITEINLNDEITTIGSYAFCNCKSLYANIGSAVETIGSYSFYGCENLPNQTFPQSLDYIGYSAFKGCTSFTEINIPQNVKEIMDNAFEDCSNVEKIILEEGVGSIGSQAFKNINKVTRLTIPTTVTYMYEGIFSGMSALEELTIPFVGKNSSFDSSRGYQYTLGYMFGSDSYTGGQAIKQHYYYSSSYIHSDSYAKTYYLPQNLTTVNITNSTSIYYDAFDGCSNLKTITLNEEITSIYDYAFYGCISLETINLPSTLTKINSYVFYNCQKLEKVEISGSVIKIENYAFYNCQNATINVLNNSNNITIYQNTFTKVPNVKYFDYCSYTNGENIFYYNIINDEAIITKTITTNTDLSLPTTLGDCVVTTIGNMGVANCETLTKVVIPANITKLSDYAFYGCTGLTTVTIPATCTYVGDYVFYNCVNLKTTTIAEGVKYVGDGVFFNCSNLDSIVIPDSCEYLGESAFYNCSEMLSATIGITVPNIQDYTFMNCSSMKTIVVGLKVATIGAYAFKNCSSIEKITLRKGVTSIGDGAFMNCSEISKVTLASTITDIGSHAFYGCSSLLNISIPALVTVIQESTFENCTSLSTASYLGVVEAIEDKSFKNTNITSFEFKEGLIELGNDSFSHSSLTTITLPDSLKTIGQYVFNGCLLTEVSLPSCLKLSNDCKRIFKDNGNNMIVSIRYVNDKILDDYLLYNSNAKSIVLSEGIEEIGDYTFAKNIFTEITLPLSLITIGNYAFYFCENLQSVNIPKNTLTIGDYAFAKNFDLSSVSVPDSLTSIGENAFFKTENEEPDKFLTINIYYNKGEIDDFLLASQYMQQVIVGDSVFSIKNSVFANCPNLVTVSIPDTVSTFGQNNFLNDNNVTLEIRNVDSVIDDNIFYDNLLFVTTVNICDGIKTIGQYAFYNDTSILVLSIPNSVNYIGQYAFYNCNSVKTINIPNGVENIYSHTFFGCSSLEEIITPNTVKVIEDYAFYGCVAVKSLSISNTCVRIENNAFYNCKSIVELVIPDSVLYIGEYAFRSCIEITELAFSDNVEEIGFCAFYDCNALEKIYLGRRIIELKDRLFYGCVNLTDLWVYAPLSYIDELSFYGAEKVVVHIGNDTYMINRFEELGIEYVIDNSIIYQYKVVFLDWDNTIISSSFYNLGDTIVVPESPSRETDNTCSYQFNGWDKNIAVCGGNAIYSATYSLTYIEYTIIFKDYDGKEISNKIYHYGDEITVPENPIRQADNTYIYEFAGWDNKIVNCESNKTYTATYIPKYIEYVVVFKDYDGREISNKTYHYNDVIEVPETPTREKDLIGTYAFSGWSEEIEICISDKIYIAQYNTTFIDYVVIFTNYDNSEISRKTYHYGDEITIPSNPMRESDNTFTYKFNGWDKEIVDCDGNKTYKATYTPIYIQYTITFKDADDSTISCLNYHYGDVIKEPTSPSKASDLTYNYVFAGWDKEIVDCDGNKVYLATYKSEFINYVIEFIDYDNSVISSQTYHYGDKIEIPNSPSRTADMVGTYSFADWDSEIVDCDGNKTYRATYNMDYINYNIIFKNYDNAVLSNETYHYGDVIVEPQMPVKPDDNIYRYIFKGWNKEITNCIGSQVYIAQYEEVYIEYTIIFKDYDGKEISNLTYHYGDELVVPESPIRQADNTYTYKFTSWNKKVSKICTGNVTYVALYESIYINYIITFLNWDNSILGTREYHYGEAIESIAIPTRMSDETFNYSFAQWNQTVSICTGNITFIAQYNQSYIEYSIVFKNEDGTVLSRDYYHYGETIVEPSTPQKESTDYYTYTFNGWDSSVSICTKNSIYMATYKSNLRTYLISYNLNGGTFKEGFEPVNIYSYSIGTELPNELSVIRLGYKFIGWTNTNTAEDNNLISNISTEAIGDKIIFAKWQKIYQYQENTKYLKVEVANDTVENGIDLSGIFELARTESKTVFITTENFEIVFDINAVKELGTEQNVIFTLSVGDHSNYENCILVFDISLNQKSFSSGKVKITYNFDEKIETSNSTKVYFVGENNNLIDMNGTITNSSVTFNTSHFSTYIIVASENKHNINAVIIALTITILIISVILVVLVILYKKKKH